MYTARRGGGGGGLGGISYRGDVAAYRCNNSAIIPRQVRELRLAKNEPKWKEAKQRKSQETKSYTTGAKRYWAGWLLHKVKDIAV